MTTGRHRLRGLHQHIALAAEGHLEQFAAAAADHRPDAAGVAAHIHGPAEPGANAPPVVPFANAASPISGTATLTDAQAADLMAGKYYVNVHTAANRGGEIRGQIVAK